MLKIILISCAILVVLDAFPQENITYQKGISAVENLNAIAHLTPYTTGGMGFDNRYEGIKGSSRLYDSLYPSSLKVKGQNYYFQIESDIDLIQNSLIILHPKTRKLLSIPAEIVIEVVISPGGNNQLFRTTGGMKFDKEIKEQKFYQVLKDGDYQFIRMPFKIMNEADYKALYSVDRRYDEYETKYRYYIMGGDNIFHQIQLNRKSLTKLFPEKKGIINKVIDSNTFKNDEEMVLSILDKF